MTYKEIVSIVAERLGLPETRVDKIYRAYWRAIKEHIEQLPLKEDITKEDFEKLQPNVSIPPIGKLYIAYDKYIANRNSYNKFIKRKEEKNATHYED